MNEFMKRSAIFLPEKKALPILLFVIGLLTGIALMGASLNITSNQTQTADVGSSFTYYFNSSGSLNETGLMSESSSPYWWVNSGGMLLINGTVGQTMQGTAPLTNLWRTLYAISNPTDTDGGTHPQNLFRLVTKSSWQNVQQEAQFYIAADHMSSSPNRNASNGLLLMSRYKDAGQTLYYTGVRVDGTAVIKKKYKGAYYTMAQKTVFPGTYGTPADKKNLLPHNEWLTLRSEVVNNSNGGVTVSLYMKRAGETSWTKIVEAADNGQYGGTAPITTGGYAGIRTDFMDVKFENYKLNVI
jgi:hypothetical protein